jgi:hypothetical protein
MGANGDAGDLTISSPLDSCGARPAVTLRLICEPAQAVCLFSPKAPARIATRTLDHPKARRRPAGR